MTTTVSVAKLIAGVGSANRTGKTQLRSHRKLRNTDVDPRVRWEGGWHLSIGQVRQESVRTGQSAPHVGINDAMMGAVIRMRPYQVRALSRSSAMLRPSAGCLGLRSGIGLLSYQYVHQTAGDTALQLLSTSGGTTHPSMPERHASLGRRRCSLPMQRPWPPNQRVVPPITRSNQIGSTSSAGGTKTWGVKGQR